jgi:hypothetical protein
MVASSDYRNDANELQVRMIALGAGGSKEISP